MTSQRHLMPLQRRHRRWGLSLAACRRPLAAFALTVLTATLPTRAAAMSGNAQLYLTYTVVGGLCHIPFHLEPNTPAHEWATYGCLATMSAIGLVAAATFVPITTLGAFALLVPAVGIGIGELGTQAWKLSPRDGLEVGLQLAALYPGEYIADFANFLGDRSLLRPEDRLGANFAFHRNADAYWLAWGSHLHNTLVYRWPQPGDAFITADQHWRGAAPAHVGALVRTGCAVGVSLAFPEFSIQPWSGSLCIGAFLAARTVTRRIVSGPSEGDTEAQWWQEEGVKTLWHSGLFLTLGLSPKIANAAMVPWFNVPPAVGHHPQLLDYYRSTNVNLREGFRARWRHQADGQNYLDAIDAITGYGRNADIVQYLGQGHPPAMNLPAIAPP